jgi:hypothetical protein
MEEVWDVIKTTSLCLAAVDLAFFIRQYRQPDLSPLSLDFSDLIADFIQVRPQADPSVYPETWVQL